MTKRNDPYGLTRILESVEAGALDDATPEQRKQVVRKLVAVAQEQVDKAQELEARFAEQAERVAAAEQKINHATELAEQTAETAAAVGRATMEAVDHRHGGNTGGSTIH